MNNQIQEALAKAAIEWDKESPADQFACEVFDDGFKRGWQAALASQAQQQITKDAIQLGTGIGLVIDGKLEHIKPEDFYLSGEDEKNIKMREQLESLPFAASQAQQTKSQWISVEEAKATLKDGDLIYVAFPNSKVSEAVYKFEQGFYPHRIISDYGNERIEHCTHVMRRKAVPLPPAPEGD